MQAKAFHRETLLDTPSHSLFGEAKHYFQKTSNEWRQLVHLWRQRSLDRTRLGSMSERLLADIGITQEEAQRIAAKPFWRT